MNELISELRRATTDIHKNLEQMPVSRMIMSPNLSLNDYSGYLKRLYLLHHFVEHHAFPLAHTLLNDLDARKKSHLIADDLHALGEALPDRPVHCTVSANPAFGLGMIYVTEGSSLGGQHIVKNASLVLGSRIEHAQRYFHAYGAQTGFFWKLFLSQMENFGATAGRQELAEVIHGAIAGFKLTAGVFSHSLPQPQA